MADAPKPQQDKKTGRFVTGNIGGGRKKGSRNLLGEAFLSAMHEDFEEHGVAAIETVRSEKPDQYLKVIASLLPKELNLNVNDAESMTDDELIARIRELDAAIHPFLVGREGATDEGVIEAHPDGASAAKPPRVH